MTTVLASVLAVALAGIGGVSGSASAAFGSHTWSGDDVTTTKVAADDSDFGAFRIAVDVDADGATAIVGAQQHNGNHGGAYVFSLVDGVWTKTADLTPRSPD